MELDIEEQKRILDIARFKTEESLCCYIGEIKNMSDEYNNVKRAYLSILYLQQNFDKIGINNIIDTDIASTIDYQAYVYGCKLDNDHNYSTLNPIVKDNIKNNIEKLDNVFNSIKEFKYVTNHLFEYKLSKEDIDNKDIVKIASHIKLCNYKQIKEVKIIKTKWRKSYDSYEEYDTILIYDENCISDVYNQCDFYIGVNYTGALVYEGREAILYLLDNKLEL